MGEDLRFFLKFLGFLLVSAVIIQGTAMYLVATDPGQICKREHPSSWRVECW